jgi:hypothetical protein
MRVTIDPAVLAKVAQIANIKDFPVTGTLLELSGLSGLKGYHEVLSQELIELLGQCGVIRTTSRKQFEKRIRTSIELAQDLAARRNAGKLKTAKIGRLARQLKEALETSSPELSHFLELPVDQCIAAVGALAKAAEQIKSLKKPAYRPGEWAGWDRSIFVATLVNAAQAAGGKLGINRRNGRGSLVEAINLLRPYLPAEFQRGLSAGTLRRIKPPAAQKPKKPIKKH